MDVIRHALAAAAGLGPQYRPIHQQLRELLRFDDKGYKPTSQNIIDIYHTLPWVDYGSTIENDDLTALLMHEGTPGGSNMDQFYNAIHPDGKKRREIREATKLYVDTSLPASVRMARENHGPQILYNYYENGTWAGPRLAVMIVDELGSCKKHGTDLGNVRYGFKAKLAGWNPEIGEFRDIKITRLFIDGKDVLLDKNTLDAANDYAARLTAMIFQDDGKEYHPHKAMQETLDKFGYDIFHSSVWDVLRANAKTSGIYNDHP